MKPNVYILIPAFNESANIHQVVTELKELRVDAVPLVNEVIVCDNNSSDDTANLAKQAGAQVISETQQGYGKACLSAMHHLRSFKPAPNDVIIFVDGDNSVETSEVPMMIQALAETKGLVVGARTGSQIQRGAMAPQQRVGNIVASALIRFLWHDRVTDLGPFRALYYGDLINLFMQDEAFGWTTEMQVKAIQKGLPYKEISVTTKRRGGSSKISGTLLGTIGAAHGIFSTIFWLWWQERSASYSTDPSDRYF